MRIQSLLIIGILLLSLNAEAGWDKIWDGPVGTVVVNYNQLSNTTRLFATNAVSGDIYIYRQSAERWDRIGGPGRDFVAAGGRLYGLAPDGNSIFAYSGTGDSWNQIGDASDGIIGGAKLYSIDPQSKDIYEYLGPNSWRKVGGPGSMFLSIGGGYGVGMYGQPPDVISSAKLYGIAPDGQEVWEYSGVPEQWSKIGGAASMLYGGGYDALYAVSGGNDIYKYTGRPEQWVAVGGPGRMFAVDTFNCPSRDQTFPRGIPNDIGCTPVLYGLSSDGKEIWRYTGVPDEWEQIRTSGFSVDLDKIYAGGGNLYAVTTRGALFQYVP
ncbi:MAG: hypothetical protein JW986_04160 [Methanotrichaceae archaeon]|nr:hypothetical protein [Methanotrichaceae archaeon]